MAAKSQPYRLSWEAKAQSIEEINERLAKQLFNANEMIDILFKAVLDLTARVEALE